MGQRAHIVLIPGFGGFGSLGAARYFYGVPAVLRARLEAAVHIFPDLPTSAVRTRAEALHLWLRDLLTRGVVRPGDDMHLVGHSTGGVDIKLLIERLLDAGTAVVSDGTLFDCIRSAQFLSTPHRGSNLARWGHRAGPLVTLTARAAFEAARFLRQRGLASLAAPVGSQPRPDGLSDVLLDSLRGFHPDDGTDLERAAARASYFHALRWLLDISTDLRSVVDLDPTTPAERGTAIQTDEMQRRVLAECRSRRIGLRSLATAAKPLPKTMFDIYAAAHALTAFSPPKALGGPFTLRRLGTEEPVRVTPSDNDGIVNTVSHVWPDEASTWLIEADHADVIGQFARGSSPEELPGLRYDLLASAAGFREPAFRALWTEIAAFAEAHGS